MKLIFVRQETQDFKFSTDKRVNRQTIGGGAAFVKKSLTNKKMGAKSRIKKGDDNDQSELKESQLSSGQFGSNGSLIDKKNNSKRTIKNIPEDTHGVKSPTKSTLDKDHIESIRKVHPPKLLSMLSKSPAPNPKAQPTTTITKFLNSNTSQKNLIRMTSPRQTASKLLQPIGHHRKQLSMNNASPIGDKLFFNPLSPCSEPVQTQPLEKAKNEEQPSERFVKRQKEFKDKLKGVINLSKKELAKSYGRGLAGYIQENVQEMRKPGESRPFAIFDKTKSRKFMTYSKAMRQTTHSRQKSTSSCFQMFRITDNIFTMPSPIKCLRGQSIEKDWKKTQD